MLFYLVRNYLLVSSAYYVMCLQFVTVCISCRPQSVGWIQRFWLGGRTESQQMGLCIFLWNFSNEDCVCLCIFVCRL